MTTSGKQHIPWVKGTTGGHRNYGERKTEMLDGKRKESREGIKKKDINLKSLQSSY